MNQTSPISPAAEFDTRAAATYLGVTAGTLEVWRCTGRYKIPYTKVGRHVRYRRVDLDRWLESRTVGNVAAG